MNVRAALLPVLLFSTSLLAEDSPLIKAPPRRPPEGSAIHLKEMEVLPDCPAEKVCADGTVENIGQRTAYAVRLKVEIGGTKYGKPRTYFVQHFEDNEMEPGEAQDFSLLIDRKFAYKDAQGADKIIEVGRFNFRVVPVWASSPVPAKPARK